MNNTVRNAIVYVAIVAAASLLILRRDLGEQVTLGLCFLMLMSILLAVVWLKRLELKQKQLTHENFKLEEQQASLLKELKEAAEKLRAVRGERIAIVGLLNRRSDQLREMMQPTMPEWLFSFLTQILIAIVGAVLGTVAWEAGLKDILMRWLSHWP